MVTRERAKGRVILLADYIFDDVSRHYTLARAEKMKNGIFIIKPVPKIFINLLGRRPLGSHEKTQFDFDN